MMRCVVGWAKSRSKSDPAHGRSRNFAHAVQRLHIDPRGQRRAIVIYMSRVMGTRLCPPYDALLLAFLMLLPVPARAEPVAEFYQGKVITLTVASSAGGEYDTLARTLARFLGNHVPGRPLVIVRDMAGAGGIAAANFLFGGAMRDGSHIGLLQNTTALAPLLGARDAHYDPLKFLWLGTPNVDTGLFAVWHTVPVNSLAEAKEREISVGASTLNSTAASYARLLNEVFGTRLKIVTGYPGQTEAFYAMERGEIEGYAAVLYVALQAAKPEWLAQKTIKPLVYYGPQKRADLAPVPYAPEVVTNENDRQLLDMAFAPLALGQPLLMPPDVPEERVAAMRKALAETFKDAQFVSEARRLGLGVDTPRSGEEVEAVIRRVLATPAGVLDRWRKLSAAPR
jgi:tripartite-type tricarboxylate transporter receptor subunit TctC